MKQIELFDTYTLQTGSNIFTPETVNKKVMYGQFFTKKNIWLKEHILDFIKASGTIIAYDPFAGVGDLLKTAQEIGFKKIKGLDIDTNLQWNYNDSLINIPHISNAIIITNPPYLSNYSAARKKIHKNLTRYFKNSDYDDLYLIALDKMLDAQNYVVAIIPETFINSNFLRKNRLHSLTVLEDNPFYDTDTPVLVACFDNIEKDLNDVLIYKNDEYINTLGTIESMRLTPNRSIKMSFNYKSGWLAVRCVDTTNPKDTLRFDFKHNIGYDWNKGIKTSSRLLTLIGIDVPQKYRQQFVDICNKILFETREKTADLIFSPFKGNMKDGRRRRRLDFFTCRAIIEKAYNTIFNN